MMLAEIPEATVYIVLGLFLFFGLIIAWGAGQADL
jgi:hypothetical protein